MAGIARRQNISITGVKEDSGGQDVDGFINGFIKLCLEINVYD